MANQLKVNKALVSASYLQSSNPIDKLAVDKAVVSAAYLQSSNPIDQLAVDKAVVSAAYLQSSNPIDKLAVDKAVVSAVYMAQPVFVISGNDVYVNNPIPGNWPITVHGTDSKGNVLSKTFIIVIDD